VKIVHTFSDEHLAQVRRATPEQILAFLEQYRLLQAATLKSTSLNMKILVRYTGGLYAWCVNALKSTQ
jgi:hypothetical protein